MRQHRLNLLVKGFRPKAPSTTCLSPELLRCQGVNGLDFLVTRHDGTISCGGGWGERGRYAACAMRFAFLNDPWNSQNRRTINSLLNWRAPE
jgi:hypothetical protein